MNQHPWRIADNTLTLYCHIQPGARLNRVCGLHDNRLKIQLQAPASDGKANKALIEFLSQWLRVKRDRITLKAGHSNRHKTLLISGICKEPDQLSKLQTDC